MYLESKSNHQISILVCSMKIGKTLKNEGEHESELISIDL
jgi:hypothetical protein